MGDLTSTRTTGAGASRYRALVSTSMTGKTRAIIVHSSLASLVTMHGQALVVRPLPGVPVPENRPLLDKTRTVPTPG